MAFYTVRPKSLNSLAHKPLTNLKGKKTTHALRLGYIQCHPDPTSHLYLCMEDEKYVIRGYNSKDKQVCKILDVISINEARRIFECTK